MWNKNQSNSDEEFWQKALSERAFVLNQLFAYPVVIIEEKAYVGGKQVTNKGGHVVDLLGMTETTRSAILIEIKTPTTPLLGSEYRKGYPFSQDISGAITQVLRYRQTLMTEFFALTQDRALIVGDIPCLVIAGHSNQLDNAIKAECFDLQRKVQGVTIITYDEMFGKLQKLLGLFEQTEAADERPVITSPHRHP